MRIPSLPLGKGRPRGQDHIYSSQAPWLAAWSSCHGSESNSFSSSCWFLLIHAPGLRPPRCPHALCQLCLIKLAQSQLGRRYQKQGVFTPCHGQASGTEICGLQPQPKQDSHFTSFLLTALLAFGHRHWKLYSPSNFVRLRECRV